MILVVDDDPRVRDVLHLMLEEEYEVIEASDGAQALAALATRKIDLVLLDLVMPGADGFEVLERCARRSRDVPIVVVSALNNAWTATAAMRLGAIDYVTKPFDWDGLLDLIRVTLTSTGGQQFQTVRAEVGYSRVLLVGTQLGVYASLTVLLRQQCRVERVETILDVLAYPAVALPDVVAVAVASMGRQPAATIRRIRAQAPEVHLVVIGDGNQLDNVSLTGCVLLPSSVHASDLLREIHAHVRQPTTEPLSYSPRVSVVLDYLTDHYTEASVRRLGRTVGASPYYLSTLFRKETGVSLRGYINQLRIEAAKWLLLETDEKIEAVATRVGLHDASHLSRLFLKHTGDRPGTYRRYRAAD